MTRYDRPHLELEYDQRALVQEGCCRFVPIVLRLCGVPVQQHVILTVGFERVRKLGGGGKPLDDYDARPLYVSPVRKGFSNYFEYALELLARAHNEETGTIRIAMTSQAGGTLSQAIFRLDSRFAEPVQAECKGFAGVRILPSLRPAEERDALQGRFSAATSAAALPEPEKKARSGPPDEYQTVSLF